MENQGTNEDDSQSDPHPEAGIFRGQTTQNSGPKDCRDTNPTFRESLSSSDSGVPREVKLSVPCSKHVWHSLECWETRLSSIEGKRKKIPKCHSTWVIRESSQVYQRSRLLVRTSLVGYILDCRRI